MERLPLLEILTAMMGTDEELDIVLSGDRERIGIRNVVDVIPLKSSNGIQITTKQNKIWLDANHVSAAWQARTDL